MLPLLVKSPEQMMQQLSFLLVSYKLDSESQNRSEGLKLEGNIISGESDNFQSILIAPSVNQFAIAVLKFKVLKLEGTVGVSIIKKNQFLQESLQFGSISQYQLGKTWLSNGQDDSESNQSSIGIIEGSTIEVIYDGAKSIFGVKNLAAGSEWQTTAKFGVQDEIVFAVHLKKSQLEYL